MCVSCKIVLASIYCYKPSTVLWTSLGFPAILTRSLIGISVFLLKVRWVRHRGEKFTHGYIIRK